MLISIDSMLLTSVICVEELKKYGNPEQVINLIKKFGKNFIRYNNFIAKDFNTIKEKTKAIKIELLKYYPAPVNFNLIAKKYKVCREFVKHIYMQYFSEGIKKENFTIAELIMSVIDISDKTGDIRTKIAQKYKIYLTPQTVYNSLKTSKLFRKTA